MSKCAICNAIIEAEEPKILSMGAYGTPRYMCDECAVDIDEVTLGRDYDRIAEAMERVGKKLAETNPDKGTFNTVNVIMQSSAERAKLIKDGSYDFSLDECEESTEDGFEEIPEELLETEEDRELDREEEKKIEKFNKVFNVVLTGAIIALAGLIIWRVLDMFVF